MPMPPRTKIERDDAESWPERSPLVSRWLQTLHTPS
jgi:hypothetical protein